MELFDCTDDSFGLALCQMYRKIQSIKPDISFPSFQEGKKKKKVKSCKSVWLAERINVRANEIAGVLLWFVNLAMPNNITIIRSQILSYTF
jgi:hypothetical protein